MGATTIERDLEGIDGVEAVLATGDDEVQVFTGAGADAERIRGRLRQAAASHGVRLVVFELADDAEVGVGADPYVVEPVILDELGRAHIAGLVLARDAGGDVAVVGEEDAGDALSELTSDADLHLAAEAALEAHTTLTGRHAEAVVVAVELGAVAGRPAVGVVLDGPTGERAGVHLAGAGGLRRAAVLAVLAAARS